MSDILQETKSLFAAIVGKPNVGKSSLINKLVGEKVAIVTSKPQTTRTRITGIVTKAEVQYVFLDTPGIHSPRTKLGERMDKTAKNTVAEVDVALMIFEPYGEFTEAENNLINEIKTKKLPCIAAVNKTDTLKSDRDFDKRKEQLDELNAFVKVIPLCVKEDKGIDGVFEEILQYAVVGPHYFPDDAYTDMPEKALVAEIIREKMLLNLYEEIPHGTAVTVESFKERAGKELIDIDVNIYCEKKSHKGMIIGKGGLMLKKISSEARIECEDFLGTHINLQCWVKVKDDWRDSDFLLNNFGFKTDKK